MTASTDCTRIGDAGENEYEPDTALEDPVEVVEVTESVVATVTTDVMVAELQLEVVMVEPVLSDAWMATGA